MIDRTEGTVFADGSDWHIRFCQKSLDPHHFLAADEVEHGLARDFTEAEVD